MNFGNGNYENVTGSRYTRKEFESRERNRDEYDRGREGYERKRDNFDRGRDDYDRSRDSYEGNRDDYDRERETYGREARRRDPREMSNDYILAEIENLKAEANELRQILEERAIQVDELQSAVGRTQAESNAMVEKVSLALAKLSEQLEETEDAITDAVERSKKGVGEAVAEANKPIEDNMKKLDEQIGIKMENMRMELANNVEKMETMRNTVEGLEDKLEDKAEKRSVVAIHQRLTTMFAIGVANVVGTIMTLALICYLILALAR